MDIEEKVMFFTLIWLREEIQAVSKSFIFVGFFMDLFLVACSISLFGKHCSILGGIVIKDGHDNPLHTEIAVQWIRLSAFPAVQPFVKCMPDIFLKSVDTHECTLF